MNRCDRNLLLMILLFAPSLALADVTLPAIFGDHMVVQRDAKMPVWGTADAGEKVTVAAAGQRRSSVADAQGRWRIVLEPMTSREPIEIVVAGKNSITIKDVL